MSCHPRKPYAREGGETTSRRQNTSAILLKDMDQNVAPIVDGSGEEAHLDAAAGSIANDVDEGAHGLHVEVVLAGRRRGRLVVGAPDHEIRCDNVTGASHKLVLQQ
jgi:hypothetical protein